MTEHSPCNENEAPLPGVSFATLYDLMASEQVSAETMAMWMSFPLFARYVKARHEGKPVKNVSVNPYLLSR